MEAYLETVTSCTDLLMQDVLRKKENPLQLLFPLIRFVGFNGKRGTSVHVHTTHIPLVVNLANLTVMLGSEGGNDSTNGPCLSPPRFSITMGIFD